MEENNLKTKVLKGFFWKFSERISAQVVSLIVSIVLARLLLPEDYGAISLVTIFITIANVFVSDGFGAALIQKEDADNIDFSSVFFSGIFLSLVLYGVLFFAAVPIAKFYNMPILVSVLRVLALRIPIAAVNSVQQAYVSRHMIFKKFFFATLFGTIVSAFIGIGMAYKGFGVWALVGQYMSNTTIDTIVLWVTVKWRPEFVFSFDRIKGLLSYGWKILAQSLLVTVYGNLRSLVIGKVYSSKDLAYYNKGGQFPNLIVTNVDSAISSTLFPAMSKAQNDTAQVRRITRKAVKISSYCLCPLLVGFAACSDSFVKIVLTEKWLPIVPYIRILCIGLLLRPAQTATLQAIKSVGRSDTVLKMDIPIRLFGLVSIMVAVKFGVLFIAIGEILVAVFGLLIYSTNCDKILGYSMKQLFSDFMPNVLLALIMGGLVYSVQILSGGKNLATLLIQVSVGGVVYLFFSIATHNESFVFLMSELRNLLHIDNGNVSEDK